MFILPRYILRAHVAPFLFGTSVVMFLFLMQFVLQKIDQLVGKGLSTWVIIQLITLNLSWMLVLAVPMGVLFSTLMAFGSMSGASEVTIMKASGSGLIRMMFPVIILGAGLTYFMFWFNDSVLPDTNHQAKLLLMDIGRKKPMFNLEQGQFSTQLEGYTILARSLDSSNGLLRGVTIYDKTAGGKVNVVSADSGTIRFTPDYSKIIVMLTHGEIHQLFQPTPSQYRNITFGAHQIVIPASGFLLERSTDGMFSRGDREMKIADMQAIVDEARGRQHAAEHLIDSSIEQHMEYLFHGDTATAPQQAITFQQATERIPSRLTFMRSQVEQQAFQIQDADSKARQYQTEIYKKYAIPVACFVFLFVGCPLGIMTRGGSFGMSAAISLGFYVLYWACLIGGEKLADRRLASPLAMWLANLIIGAMGLLLTIRINNESISFGWVTALLAKFKRKEQPTPEVVEVQQESHPQEPEQE